MTVDRSPEPGWYPDPTGSANLRWWNGVSWSDSTHALPGAPALPDTVTYPSIFADDPEQGVRRRGRSVVAVVVAVVLLGVAIVAVVAILTRVANQTRLDTAAVEQQVAESLSQSTGLTTTVVCPDDVTLAAASSFTCTATTDDGAAAIVEVTQGDDQGNVTWRLR